MVKRLAGRDLEYLVKGGAGGKNPEVSVKHQQRLVARFHHHLGQRTRVTDLVQRVHYSTVATIKRHPAAIIDEAGAAEWSKQNTNTRPAWIERP
jgi:hypothetical protein